MPSTTTTDFNVSAVSRCIVIPTESDIYDIFRFNAKVFYINLIWGHKTLKGGRSLSPNCYHLYNVSMLIGRYQ